MIATPSRVADVLHRRQRAGGRAGCSALHPGHDDRRQRRDREPHPGADQHQPGTSASTEPPVPTSGDRSQQRSVASGEHERSRGQHPAAVAHGERRRAQRGDQIGAARIVNTSPACSALRPRPCCRYSASTRKNEAWPHQNTSCASSPALNARCGTGSSSSSGEPPRLREPALVRRRTRAGSAAQRERAPRPRRPAVLATFDERQHDRGQSLP